ncbi:MAG: hypothetical protein GY729_02295 [Desulfobacteraceae bacterium]|nr:hypothetical protein [Desulfobacteraceae bacterium]
MKPNNAHICVLACFFITIFLIQNLMAGQKTLPNNINNQFGGHIKFEGGITGIDSGSYFEPVGTETCIDGLANVRLTDKLSFSDNIYIQTHYEAFFKFGETYEKQADLQKINPSLPGSQVSNTSNIDKRRLFDLTKTIKESDNAILWHRLDRLLVSVKPSWGDIMIGRQAITWGNGLIFNPMDLFNPFSPSDIVRDYKTGDDLASVRFHTDSIEEVNLLYVPRRNITTNEIDSDKSSIAGKCHFFAAEIEVDIMGALHYDQIVLGLGGTGYVGDAAWRSDLVWSALEDSADKSGYIQFVANIDYSWVWWNKNMYGLIEYYHNGLGKNNYTRAMEDPVLMERIDRGELFSLGKNYLNTRIQLELHPLFNLYLNTINNIEDPSGILQPWAIYNMTQNSTLLLGANIYYGSKGSEYGPFLIPGTPFYTNAAANAYILFTYYF